MRSEYMQLPFEARNATLTIVRDTRELASADFDGSKLGSVTLDDGTEILVLVDVNDGHVSFDAWHGSESDARWVRDNHDELESEWDERETV